MKLKSTLASVLIVVMVMTACTADQVTQSINIGIQVAGQLINILSSSGVLGTNNNLQVINTVMTEAQKDLGDLESLYNQWKSASAADKPGIAQKIQDIGNLIQTNLATLLADAHVKNSTIINDVTAAVAVINTAVLAVLALMPQLATAKKAPNLPTVPGAKKPDDLKKYWNQQHPGHQVS